jgi:hypothetical protein
MSRKKRKGKFRKKRIIKKPGNGEDECDTKGSDNRSIKQMDNG